MSAANFYNQNLNRAYPFLRGTTARPESGPLTLLNAADSLIVDAGFVLGPKSGFDASAHSVYLESITRSGGSFLFEFHSDAPAVLGVPLVFTRSVSDPDFSLEYADSGDAGISAVSLSVSESGSTSLVVETCDDPMWSGFMVSGKMADLELLLPSNGSVSRSGGAFTLEPALVQSLARSYVTQLALANDDRTRVSAAAGCDEVVFPYPVGVVHVNDRCLTGELYFKPGYSALMRQGLDSITLGAGAGLGEGEPCDEVKLFPTEVPPAGSALLSGGPQCNETVRSFNGVGGRQFTLTAGRGVNITSVPEEHKIVIDVSLSGLAIQYRVSASSASC